MRAANEDVSPVGYAPPLGQLPQYMHAAVIRQSTFGEPASAFRHEVVPVPKLGPHEVLVYVMAAGINYNGVWAALGTPVDVVALQQRSESADTFHIAGSDASGVVWAVGDQVTRVRVGDHVVLSCAQWAGPVGRGTKGDDPMLRDDVRIWGYEVSYGSFAQFTRVQEVQCFPKPENLTWEEAACYMLVGATAYRQLCTWHPHVVQRGDVVLIWGAAGGLGSMAIQITRHFGGIPVAVVSDDERAAYCRKLGAVGVINRKKYQHWGRLPDLDDEAATNAWMKSARAMGKEIWASIGERKNPKIVFEHSGEGTIPTSMYVCATGGMVVICAGTTGYNADLDLRHLWMRQKRLQGSHFANPSECEAFNHLIREGAVAPCLSRTFQFGEIGEAHQLMRDNRHPPGNMAVLVGARRPGSRTLEH